MINDSIFQAAIEDFKWESDEQREGFLGLVKYWSDNGQLFAFPMRSIPNLTYAFFIQKMHEAHLWWNETLGSRLSEMQDEIRKLQTEIHHLHRDVKSLNDLAQMQAVVINLIAKDQSGTGIKNP